MFQFDPHAVLNDRSSFFWFSMVDVDKNGLLVPAVPKRI